MLISFFRSQNFVVVLTFVLLRRGRGGRVRIKGRERERERESGKMTTIIIIFTVSFTCECCLF